MSGDPNHDPQPGPYPTGCGGDGQRPCPPKPSSAIARGPLTENTPAFTYREHDDYGEHCFQAGIAKAKKSA